MELFYHALKQGNVSLPQLDSALSEQASRTCPAELQHSIELENTELWKEFHKYTNEMIITKAGRRMFPLIQLVLKGLDPHYTYYLLLALRVKDSYRWRFLNGEWTNNESAIRGVASVEAGPVEGCIYLHPLSPNTGEVWMQQSPVGLSKLKLSNKEKDGGKVKLSSLHRYQPVVYLVKLSPGDAENSSREAQTEDLQDVLPQLDIFEHEFPETQFIAVTAYQNEMITQMKIKHNPFAKAFLPNQDKPTKLSASAGSITPTSPDPLMSLVQGQPLPIEPEAVYNWPPPSSYLPPHPPVHFQPVYYYGDGRYPPPYPDYYDMFAPVPPISYHTNHS